MNAEQIANQLGKAKKTGAGQYLAQCLVHEDKNPSLSICDGRDGKILVHCHAGCAQEEVVDALKIRGLWPMGSADATVRYDDWSPIIPVPKSVQLPDTTHFELGSPEHVWQYKDQQGRLLCLVCRYDVVGGGKEFRPMSYCQKGNRAEWRWKRPAGPLPFYGLDRLAGSIGTVLIVEGEKAADSASRILGASIPVLSIMGGSNAVRQMDLSSLVGLDIVYWPDADSPGQKAVRDLAKGLKGTGEGLRVVQIPDGVCKGWDLADAEVEGWSKDQVLGCINESLRMENVASDCTECSSKGTNPLVVTNGQLVEYQSIDWLWPGWLAVGKVHILAGPAGVGKTTIAVYLAASLTTKGNWPDGSKIDPAEVAIWSGEDAINDTLAPRFKAAGAAMERVHFIAGIRTGNECRSFDPSIDLDHLRRYLLDNNNIKLLIVDPVVAVGIGDSHKNTEVRRDFKPLVDLAADCGCAILGITHFKKNSKGTDPLERVTGSVAYGAVTRIVLVAEKDRSPGAPIGALVLLRTKSNIGPDTGGWYGRVVAGELKSHSGIIASRVLMGDYVDASAQEVLEQIEGEKNGNSSAIDEAGCFLRELLLNEPVEAKIVFEKSEEVGIARKTLNRAKRDLGVRSVKGGMDGRWSWELPRDAIKVAQNDKWGKLTTFDTLDLLDGY